jgi:hypothetical protein
MKVNVLIFAGLLSLIVCTGASALGIGVQFNGNASDVFLPGAALAVSPNDTTHLTFNWYFGKNATTLGLAADFWILDSAISSFSGGSFNFFLGGGLYTNFGWAHDGGDSFFRGGVRIPIGVHLYLNRQMFEVFAQVAPSLGLQVYPAFGVDSSFLPFALGFRFWLR